MPLEPVAFQKTLKLDQLDPEGTHPYPGTSEGKSQAKKDHQKMASKMYDFQERLFAEGKQALLVVLQAMDTGGKDSTIRRVFGGINPQGCRVHSFKKPTELELSHHFLWRVFQKVPPKGYIGIFNRSHYEDVLITRVHGQVTDALAQTRFEEIIQFEKSLVESGTQILKFYLHISKDEQKERLQDRVNKPEKHWKFNPQDLTEREKWGLYQRYYEEALAATSWPGAPWYVVPANRKWARDIAISTLVNEKLKAMDPQYPPPDPEIDFKKIKIP